MWIPDKSKLVKVCLHSQGEDVETPWAEDLGEVPGRPGARLVRLGNVPFLHAKPTYGDVLLVEPDETYRKLTWDDRGVPFERIRERIAEDGGRYAMILDYAVSPSAPDVQTAFTALDKAGENVNIAVEGGLAPTASRPGRAYLAVPYKMTVEAVLLYLRAQSLPMLLTLVHPVEEE